MQFTMYNVHNQFIGLAPVMFGAWETWAIYLFMISSYVPGVYFLIRNQYLFRLPVLVFFFIGLFIFHAIGSLFVLISPFVVTGAFLFSEEYVWIVFLQPLTFYMAVWLYWRYCPKPGEVSQPLRLKLNSFILIAFAWFLL